MKILCKLIFKPFRVIKGQIFCGQWTGDKRLNITDLLYNSFGLISKAAEDVASKALKIHVFDYPTVV